MIYLEFVPDSLMDSVAVAEHLGMGLRKGKGPSLHVLGPQRLNTPFVSTVISFRLRQHDERVSKAPKYCGCPAIGTARPAYLPGVPSGSGAAGEKGAQQFTHASWKRNLDNTCVLCSKTKLNRCTTLRAQVIGLRDCERSSQGQN